MEAVLIKICLEAGVSCKINPFVVMDSELILSPPK